MRLVLRLAILCVVFTWSDAAYAQRRPIADDTLGEERSIVTPEDDIRGLPGDRIEGGARRGDNLFHSFQEFNIDPDRAVYFDDPGVINILSRVTGGTVSEILGRLGVLGDANLFLINPSGILFGEGASLDVSGSFVSTTADAIQFGDQGFFSASEPNAPPLLTVQPSAFLFNQLNPGAIENQSASLQVPDGQNLLLVGGNISMDDGALFASGGQVELGGLTEPGSITLNTDGSLAFPINVAQSDISLTSGAFIYVMSESGGSVTINAQNLSISNSVFFAGNSTDLDSIGTQAGDITLTANGTIEIVGSIILNTVLPEAVGDAGDITVTARSLSLNDGTVINASTLGRGNAGDITLSITDALSLAGLDGAGSNTFIQSGVNEEAVGNGGNIRIQADSLILTDGASINSNTFGQGDAGNITLSITNPLSLAGLDGAGNNSYIESAVSESAVGNGGNITIGAGSLTLRDGAYISSGTSGRGNAGNIALNVTDTISLTESSGSSSIVSAVGMGAVGDGGTITIEASSLTLESRTSLTSGTLGRGNAGDIALRVGSLALQDGAFLSSNTSGNGNAGDITLEVNGSLSLVGSNSAIGSVVNMGAVGEGSEIFIRADSLALENGAFINSGTAGQGNTGNITIEVNDILSLTGRSSTGRGSSIGNVVGTGAVGEGGEISIRAGSLILEDGAYIVGSTLGQGNAANITISVTDLLTLRGRSGTGRGSGIQSLVSNEAVGNGGDIFIQAGSFILEDGVELDSSTFGEGNAGNITLEVDETLVLRGRAGDEDSSIIRSLVGEEAMGDGGNITIEASSIVLNDGAELNSNTSGEGDAGNITLRITDTLALQGRASNGLGSSIQNAVDEEAVGDGGDITIKASSITLDDGAFFSSSTLGEGNAGNINLRASDSLSLTGSSRLNNTRLGSFITNNVGREAVGNGGNITIRANSMTLDDGAFLTSDTLGQGRAGNITLKISDIFSLAGRNSLGLGSVISTSVSEEAVGNGGSITIAASSVMLEDGAFISSGTLGNGDAGNITLEITDTLSLAGLNEINGRGSFIASAVGENADGNQGAVTITASSLSLTDNARLTVNNAAPRGEGGDIEIQAHNVELDEASQVTAETASGQGGNITLSDVELLQLRNGSLISTTAGTQQAGGDGGNIAIDADFIVAFPGEDSDIRANAYEGSGGNIDITTEGLFGIEERDQPTDLSDITASSELGVQGQININTPDVDPSRGLTELPEDVVDASDQIAQTCPTDGNVEELGEFIVTGRGGLPANPAELLGGETVLSELAEVEGEGDEEDGGEGEMRGETDRPSTATNPQPEIVEAQGWVVGADGKVMLTAENPAVEPHSPATVPVHCARR